MFDGALLIDVALTLAPTLFILLNFALVDLFYGDDTLGLQTFLAIIFAGVTLFATYLFGGLTGYIVAKIATFAIVGRCLFSARRR